MDPFTQGLLGASISGSFAKKKTLKVAAICGAIGGMAPDLDAFIKSANDSLLSIEYHRHFSHSLAFVPLGGLFVTLFLYFFFKNKISFKNLYTYTTTGFLSHGLLDACTSYGTRLLWPFSDLRVSWNIISIIDPTYTIILFIFIVLCLLRKSPFLIRVGTSFSFFYLIFGLIKYEQVKVYVSAIANNRGHEIKRMLLNPTIGNNFLWRSVYQSGEKYYVDAVYMPLFSKPLFKEGAHLDVIDKETIFSELNTNSVQRQDIRRFSYFAQDFIYLHNDYEYMIADLRYGTLPYDDKSLWGIKIDVNNSDQHAIFQSLRNFNASHYNEFWLMLKGKFN
jgi:inner membrane protein